MKEIKFSKSSYQRMLRVELLEWKRIEKQTLAKGIPWWTDRRRAFIKGKNLFWREDPVKDEIIRGQEKDKIIRLAHQSGIKVLDIGCGSGWLSLELARLGMDVTGIDVSQDRIDIAKFFLKQNPYKKNFGKVKYIAVDINEIDFPINSFDVIVAWDTLHHFPNLKTIISKTTKWLRPKGSFVTFDHLSNPTLKHLRKIADFFTFNKHKHQVVEYEDLLGKEMLNILSFYFHSKEIKTKLSFPVSIALYLFLSYDLFTPLLPSIERIDKLLCDNHLFTGEYFFFYGKKK